MIKIIRKNSCISLVYLHTETWCTVHTTLNPLSHQCQVGESTVLDKWKMSKTLMTEQPRHSNANWHVIRRRKQRSPSAPVKHAYKSLHCICSHSAQVRKYDCTVSLSDHLWSVTVIIAWKLLLVSGNPLNRLSWITMGNYLIVHWNSTWWLDTFRNLYNT